MRALVSFPGRAGDLLWACCAIRSLSAVLGVPVDLQITGEFESLVDLLAQQPYLGRVWADHDWDMTQTAAAPTASRGDRRYDFSADIGYRRWPALPLPNETWENLAAQFPGVLPPLDLHRPWIAVQGHPSRAIAVGWTDCHFELKFGLSQLLFTSREAHPFWEARLLPPPGSRWVTEGLEAPVGWLKAARYIAGAPCFVGDCSALHVLAVALGKRVVCYEPMQERLNDIFWPLGKDGPQVTLVRGNDGEMTTDSRHVEETLGKVLGEVQRYGR